MAGDWFSAPGLFSYLKIYFNSWQGELPPRLGFPGHMAEELPAVLVPLNGVEHVCGPERPAARELGARAQGHVGGHAQLLKLEAGHAILCEQGNKDIVTQFMTLYFLSIDKRWLHAS